MTEVRKSRAIEAFRRINRSPHAAVEAEVEHMRDLSYQEQGERLVAACRAAWAVLRSRPDFHQIVAYADPLPADFAEKWNSLVARRRVQQQKNHGPR